MDRNDKGTTEVSTPLAPEQGQLVRVRNRLWLVSDTVPHEAGGDGMATRANLLIADDVELGKTIEAGLVLQEMLARARVRNCLITCPASLQRQWQEEMEENFNLEFRSIDWDALLQRRRQYGSHVNPWWPFGLTQHRAPHDNQT